jgi:hypothetical protein
MLRTRAVAVALLLLVPLAACSSDDDGGDDAADEQSQDASGGDAEGGEGDGDAFCALLEDSADADVDPTTDEGRALMGEILDAAPDDLRPEIAAMFELFEQMEAIDEDDPEAFAEALALVFDPEFIAAGEALEAYAVDECGLPPGTISGEDDGAVPGEGEDEDGDDSSGEDDDALSTDAIEAWLADNYADADWHDLVTARWSTDAGIGVGGDFTDDQALAACDALLEFLDEVGEDADVQITDADGTLADSSDGACELV